MPGRPTSGMPLVSMASEPWRYRGRVSNRKKAQRRTGQKSRPDAATQRDQHVLYGALRAAAMAPQRMKPLS
jgi:hypothetical protein